MPLTSEQKQRVVADAADRLSRADVVVFTNFHGLGVDEMTSLRRQMRADGIEYVVLKKRLLGIALKQSGVELEYPLEGELGVAFGYDDATAAAREAHTFAKTHKDEFRIIGGIMGGKAVGREQIIALATIPSRDVLLGQLANVLQSPISGLARTLNAAAAGQFVLVLARIGEAKA